MTFDRLEYTTAGRPVTARLPRPSLGSESGHKVGHKYPPEPGPGRGLLTSNPLGHWNCVTVGTVLVFPNDGATRPKRTIATTTGTQVGTVVKKGLKCR